MRYSTLIEALWTGLMAAPSCLRACMSLPRAQSGLDERIAMIPTSSLPLRAPVIIHFDQHQIPFIRAEEDRDAAFVLGLLHAHLRLAQMEVLRHLAFGRAAEMLGPLAVPLDETLRSMDLARAVPLVEAALPERTRMWMEAYVDGINVYLRRSCKLPLEFNVLGLRAEAFSLRDIIAIGRLASCDINWLIGAMLLKHRRRDGWSELWAKLTSGADHGHVDARLIAGALQSCSRSGSNCLTIGAERTRRRGAILAGDPHLGLLLPNPWLIVGLRSPSFHIVGLMVPGLPVFMVGRTERIAWGGTYLRAASSDFVDVSGLCRSEMRQRRERLQVRWWRSIDITIPETEWGPVVSNCPLFQNLSEESFALRWIGHDQSDEFSAFLEAAGARNFESFRAAFRPYAVSGQTLLYADVEGIIGRITAARLPIRSAASPPDLPCSPSEAVRIWSQTINVEALPAECLGKGGCLVSANERPQSELPIGYFFSPADRTRRMVELLNGQAPIDREYIFRLQCDVFVRSSMELSALILDRVRRCDIATTLGPDARTALGAISGWDGNYTPSSEGALAFEVCRAVLVADLCEPQLIGDDIAAYASVAEIVDMIRESIARVSAPQFAKVVAPALAEAGRALHLLRNWGGAHRLRVCHPLGLLPVIGRSFTYADLPAGGSSESLMKTAHGPVRGRHNTLFGSDARYVFDLSDPDENHFVLLGGQDGWIGSTTFLDQLPLWQSGGYIQVPLRLEAARSNAAISVQLMP